MTHHNHENQKWHPAEELNGKTSYDRYSRSSPQLRLDRANHTRYLVMPKPAGKKKYSAGQMKIARVAPPRDKITGADFAKLRKNGKKKGSKPVSRKR